MFEDLCDFAKAGSWTHILDNCKWNQPVFQLPAKTLRHLKVTAHAVEYDLDTG